MLEEDWRLDNTGDTGDNGGVVAGNEVNDDADNFDILVVFVGFSESAGGGGK